MGDVRNLASASHVGHLGDVHIHREQPLQRPVPATFQLPEQFLFVDRPAVWGRLTHLWTTPHSVSEEAEDGHGETLREMKVREDSVVREGKLRGDPPFIVVLTGLGGIGKSQLALRYSLSTRLAPQSSPTSSFPSLPSYTLRAWFDASSADQLQSTYCTFATACLQLRGIDRSTRLEDVRAAVKNWLDAQPSWLLVFDNVEVYDDVAPYLPSVPSASASLSSPSSSSSASSSSLHTARHVLITSRHQHWPPPPLVQQLQVDEGMTSTESVELLVGLMHRRKQQPLDECRRDAHYLTLVAQLQHYPLAISQAGAFLNQRQDVQLSAYAAQCESNLLHRQVLPTGDIRKDRNRDTVAFTFLTSIQAVEDETSEQGMEPVGRALLTVLAYLHADDIPVPWLGTAPAGVHRGCDYHTRPAAGHAGAAAGLLAATRGRGEADTESAPRAASGGAAPARCRHSYR